MIRSRSAGDGGQATVFVVIMSLALIFTVGLVFDGGNLLSAKRAAANEAAQAARAGAQSLSDAEIRAGRIALNAGAAEAAAKAFVTTSGHRVTDVRVVGPSIRVTVEVDQRLYILAGGTVTLTGTATACSQRGIQVAETGCPPVP